MSTPRILIVRTSALGDIVHALPVLTAVRKRFKNASIGWAVEEAFEPLLRDHPFLDEIFVIRSRWWRRQPLSAAPWREAAAFAGKIQSFSPEIVLDLMGNHKAGVISALSLGERRIGLRFRDRREPSSAAWISEPVTAHGQHAVERMLSVLSALDIPRASPDFSAHLLLEEPVDDIAEGSPFVLLHPATGWSNKDYPEAGWATVARQLDSRHVEVVVAPGPGEEAKASRIVERAPAARLLPPVSLPGLVYLQRRASLVLGGDTGPLHLAHALGTSVLCVMGPTDPQRNGPYGAPESAISQALACSFCYKRLEGTRACLLAIEPRSIVERSLSALSGESLH